MWGNQARGRKAKIQGAQFEVLLQRECQRQGIHVIQMPLGCRRVGKNKLFQIKTPFDFTLIQNGVAVFLDAKSFDSDRITHSQLTSHQVDALKRISESGCLSGYIVFFRKDNIISFFNAEQLFNLDQGFSYHYSEGMILGSIENMCLGTLFG